MEKLKAFWAGLDVPFKIFTVIAVIALVGEVFFG